MSDASVRAIDGRAVVRVAGSELLEPLLGVAGLAAAAAEAGADRSETAADRSEAERIAAGAFAASAQATSRYFPSRAAGEAGSATGQSFSTTDGSGNLITYERTAGGSVEVARPLTKAGLAGENGAKASGFRATPTAPLSDVDTALKAQPLTPAVFGTAKGVTGNVAAFSAFLAAQERIPSTAGAPNPRPKLHLISEPFNGKPFQGFPAAVRYQGKDYIFYREGAGHVEASTITNTSRFVVAVRDIGGPGVIERQTIYAPSGIDPRDPCILRDDHGNAILVGGKFKVVAFEYAGSYGLSTASIKVWDLDPTNLAAGLTNPVTVPGAAKACKSDVRQLSNGSYAFVGYDANHCYLITTADWTTFSVELIGPGNEAAICETVADGTINVIARTEEQFGHEASIFYKRALSGGAWRVHDVLPYTLNAPTFVKGYTYVQSAAPGGTGSEGWMLFARDKTGRLGLDQLQVPVGELVCFWSRNSSGAVLDRFVRREVIANILKAGAAPSGDNHYSSVIASQGGQFAIYTYGEFATAFDTVAGSFTVATWYIDAALNPNIGVETRQPDCLNCIQNPAFKQGATGFSLPAGAAIVSDETTERKLLRITNGLSNSVECFASVRKNDTLFPKLRMRTTSTNQANGQHIQLLAYDMSSGSAVLVRTMTPQLPLARFAGEWRTVIFPPIVAPSEQMLFTIKTVSGITAAVSDIAWIEFSDDYSPGPARQQDVPPIFRSANNVAFGIGTGAGAQKGTLTYSAAVWPQVGLRLNVANIPFPARTLDDVEFRLENITTQNGALKLIQTGATINSNGSVTVDVAVAPGESGTIGGVTRAKIVALIAVPSWPFNS